MGIPLLAFLSGIPALVYQVVWTREVGLLAGSQIEGVSLVLAIFFGGLALGARAFGGRADRATSPLRLYGALEGVAGLLAVLSVPALRAGGRAALEAGGPLAALLGAGILIFPVTLCLGGTVPALVRSAVRRLPEAPRLGGRLVGANTAGAVVGVVLAMSLLPAVGQLRAMTLAGLSAIGVGSAALALARGRGRPSLAPAVESFSGSLAAPALLAAFAAGVATLAFEVLAARLAALRLGSSLYAWGSVLALFLLGLAAGNALSARRASVTPTPARDLGRVQTTGAVALAAGLALLAPDWTAPARGLTDAALLSVMAGVLPPAVAMGAAFPFFVRLAARRPELGSAFGTVSALNTAGGIAGSLLAPFLLLPRLGPVGGALVCAGWNAALGAAFLWAGAKGRPRRAREPALGLAALAASLSLLWWVPPRADVRALHVAHGRQATAAVTLHGAQRDLLVDGDPEASTAGNARLTEELLALLPLRLHPRPEALFEVGFGAGISLGTAARFPLQLIECAEIAGSVLDSAPFFEPDNGGVASGTDPRVRILRTDGRAALLQRPARYDVVLANTLHPWSVGATGLYSRQYFERLAEALRPGGLAVQWLPIEHLGADNLESILRTFFAAFPHGGLWWGAESLLAVGSREPPREPREPFAPDARLEGLRAAELLQNGSDLRRRRLARAGAVRAAIGPGEVLSDDRPILEARAARRRGRAAGVEELAVLERIAAAGAGEDPEAAPLHVWIRSRLRRAAGDAAAADLLEQRAADAGLALARRAKTRRQLVEGREHLDAGRLAAAEAVFREALASGVLEEPARFGLGLVELEAQRYAEAEAQLERVLAIRRQNPEAWNLLGVARARRGEAFGARRALEHALEVSPFFPEAIANLGLVAEGQGDRATARRMLERLRSLGAGPPLAEEAALARALAER